MSPTPGEAIQAADPLVPQDSTHLSFTEPVTSCSAPDGVLSATDCPKMQRAKNAPAHCRSKVPPPSGGRWQSSTTAPFGLFRELSCNRHCVLLNIVAPVVGAGEKKKDVFLLLCKCSYTSGDSVHVCSRKLPLVSNPLRVLAAENKDSPQRRICALMFVQCLLRVRVCPLTFRPSPVCVSTINKQC